MQKTVPSTPVAVRPKTRLLLQHDYSVPNEDVICDNTVLNVMFVGSFRQFKTSLPYAAAKTHLHIADIGDGEDLRLSIGESTALAVSDFDRPSQTAIKAYYRNRASGRTGKIIVYRHVKNLIKKRIKYGNLCCYG